MISTISNCKSVSAAECHNSLDSNSNLSNGVTKSLDKVCNDSAGKVNQHSDLKRMPVFDMDDKSRLESLIKELNEKIFFSEKIIPFLNLTKSIKKDYILYESAIKGWFFNEKKHDVIQALNFFQVDKKNDSDDFLTISTRYYPIISTNSLSWSGDVLVYFRQKIIALSGDFELLKGGGTIQIISNYPGRFYKVNLEIANKDINKKILGLIFYSLHQTFMSTFNSDRFLLAICASSLRNYLYHYPPKGMVINEIIDEVVKLPEFFKIGDIMLNILWRRKLWHIKSALEKLC